jgi:hypothetical protein
MSHLVGHRPWGADGVGDIARVPSGERLGQGNSTGVDRGAGVSTLDLARPPVHQCHLAMVTMNPRSITRRQFLEHAGAAAGLVLVGCAAPRKHICPTAPPMPFVRRDVGGLAATDPLILTYESDRGDCKRYRRTIRNWVVSGGDPRDAHDPGHDGMEQLHARLNLFWSWHRMLPLLVRAHRPEDVRRHLLDAAVLELERGDPAPTAGDVSRHGRAELYT